eukprot:UN00650
MPLECCMLCIDSSDYMRNGDLNPTRLQAQQAAVTSLARHKLDDNAESAFGLLTMAGHKVDVHLSPSREYWKLITQLKKITPYGQVDLITALKVSQLTLRNRINKHQRQRIVLFIGSPIDTPDSTLERAAKELKKNNVAIDIVLFGLEIFTDITNRNIEKALILVNGANTDNNSHLVVHYEQQFDAILATLPEENAQKKIIFDKYNNYIAGHQHSTALTDVVIRSVIGRNIQPQASRPQQSAPTAAAAAPKYSAEVLRVAAELDMDPSEVSDELLE